MKRVAIAALWVLVALAAACTPAKKKPDEIVFWEFWPAVL